MTKKKPPPERLRPKTDDAELALAEACKLLGCGGDPSKLCGADRVRVGMVAGLMAAVDAATESLLAGNSSAGDIGRLTSSVDALIRLLPKAATEPAQTREDPRKALLDLILTMRDRDEIADRAEEPSLREEIAALRTENEMLRRAARAAGASVTPPEADVVPPGELGEFYVGGPKPGPDDHLAPPRTPRVIEGEAMPAPSYDYDRERGWRDHVQPDGSISPTPFGGGRKWWGPV
jgi:hypothetical protein